MEEEEGKGDGSRRHASARRLTVFALRESELRLAACCAFGGVFVPRAVQCKPEGLLRTHSYCTWYLYS